MLQKYLHQASLTIFFLVGIAEWLLPVQAETLPWHVVEGGRVRIAYSSPDNDRKANSGYGIVEIDLKPGWKTYWRNPGNSGMAPEIVTDSPGNADFLFPVPQILKNGRDWVFGYREYVFLPFRITLPSSRMAQTVSGSILIGLCSTVCIPKKIPFQFRIDEKADWLTRERIAAILAGLPGPEQDNFQIRELKSVRQNLHVLLQHPESSTCPQLFMDGNPVQLGIAKIKQHKSTETLYIVPIISGKFVYGQMAHYTAVLDHQVVSGTRAVTLDTDRGD